MQPINLYCLYLYTKNNLNNIAEAAKYYAALGKFPESEFLCKTYELQSFNRFIEVIVSKISIKKLDSFYYQYKIPQIGKEFDLLKLSDKKILNIELKSELPPSGLLAVEDQLIKNRYYLNFLNKEVITVSFIADINKFFQLKENGQFSEIDANFLAKLITEISDDKLYCSDLDLKFKPSQYLVSPLNNAESFLRGNYFLTQEQLRVKNQIFKDLLTCANFFLIQAKAGTGKTLLLYNIALELAKRGKVLLIHCAQLCDGHSIIEKKIKNLNIISISSIWNCNLQDYNFILIDEAHRLRESRWNQLKNISAWVLSNNLKCIMCYDGEQVISKDETLDNVAEKINELSNKINYTLTERIRTNKNLARFIQKLFHRKRQTAEFNNLDVNVYFANNENEAHELLQYYRDELNYTFISHTPSQYTKSQFDKFYNENTAHKVIGQEFNNVIVVLNSYYFYDKEGYLSANQNGVPYSYVKMLYQEVTRTRDKLVIVVMENKLLFEQILEIVASKP